MNTLRCRSVVSGDCFGKAMVTRQPMNFTAAFAKPNNAAPWRRDVIEDGGHELFRKRVRGRVLVFPACVGSTMTGLILLELVKSGRGPAGIVVQDADTLLVAGIVVSGVFFDRRIPVMEYPDDDLFERIREGDALRIRGEAGTVEVLGDD